ncbi:hypothetical protein H5410_062603 [Solanum commersonii]|uniref:Uncharacterized protein n=1 Tax=Solanum commersonii TaxID=4109 RepID=A0A9J5WBC4_SOLCO|nr:hypothetical protein H5410_062603 [Solanum commersonii]
MQVAIGDSKIGTLVLLAISNGQRCSEDSMCGCEDNVESMRLGNLLETVNKGLRSNVYIRRRTRTSLKLEFRSISKEGCKGNILEKKIIVELYYGAIAKLLKKMNAKASMGAPKSPLLLKI